jgi:hypothetical protein
MRFVCLVYVEEHAMDGLTSDDHARFDKENLAFDTDLQRRGHYVLSTALAQPADAVTLRVRNGKLSRTDGPFAETKEYLGGFLLIEARDLEEAVAIASTDPMAAFGSIEVRPAMNLGDPKWEEWAAASYDRR